LTKLPDFIELSLQQIDGSRLMKLPITCLHYSFLDIFASSSIPYS
jgi:hypothetical protein